MFSYIENNVLTPQGVSVRMEYPVRCLIEDACAAYIVLDVPLGDSVLDNVVCLSPSGEIAWKISGGFVGLRDAFEEGRLRADGRLEFWNSDAWAWVDKRDGKIIAVRAERFGPFPESDGQWDRSDVYFLSNRG